MLLILIIQTAVSVGGFAASSFMSPTSRTRLKSYLSRYGSLASPAAPATMAVSSPLDDDDVLTIPSIEPLYYVEVQYCVRQVLQLRVEIREKRQVQGDGTQGRGRSTWEAAQPRRGHALSSALLTLLKEAAHHGVKSIVLAAGRETLEKRFLQATSRVALNRKRTTATQLRLGCLEVNLNSI